MTNIRGCPGNTSDRGRTSTWSHIPLCKPSEIGYSGEVEFIESSEPDRMLKTLKVNWDSETSDVQAQDGTVFRDVPWDELEFWNPEDYHLAGE